MSSGTTRLLATASFFAALCACSEKAATTDRATIRLSPEAVSAAGVDGARLVDRDTTAPVQVSSTTTVTLRFRHDVEIRRVKVHGARSVRVGVQGLTLGDENAAGWAAGTLSARITAREVVVTLEPTGADAQVNEVEVWGAGADVETRDIAAVAESTRSEEAPERENVWVLRATPGSATLKPGAAAGESCLRARFPAADPRQARRAYLVFEADVPRAVALQHSFDAGAPSNGFWLGTTPGSRTLVHEIDPERLRGSDELLLCLPDDADGKVSIAGLRLLLLLDDGREAFDRQAAGRFREALDRDDATATSFSAGAQVLELDRARDVEAAVLRLAHVPARLEGLARNDGGSWVEQGGLELRAATTELPVKGRASALRVSFAGSARPDVPAAAVVGLELTGSGVGPRSGSPRIVLIYPATTERGDREVGERFGPKAYLSGWAESPSGRGTVELEGARVDVDGAFSQLLRRPLDSVGSWPVTLRARFPDGSEVSRTVYLDDDREGELLGDASAGIGSDDLRFGRENQSRYGAFDPAAGGKVALGTDVYVEAPAGAVGARTSIGITRKGHEVMPRLDPGMINVTAPAHAAYRFLPKGQKFAKAVKVVIPYDPDLLPEGVLPEEVQTYYFDEAKDRWFTLPRREVLRDSKQVVSETTHFTFMINAVMVLPDHPGPVSFNPNSIKDLKAADPSAGIDLVEPPQGSNQGTARLGFPIRLPRARGAYQPSLSLTYDSGGGNGWLGAGWDVSVSRIQIDGRFGVPEYGGQERYLLDGEAIVPVDASAVSGKCIDGQTLGRGYRARLEGAFRKIVRCGDDPTRYWFEVTDKGGTLFVYGHGENARLTSYIPRVVTPPVFPPVYDIAEWYLERVVDANRNLTEFAYQHDSPAGAESTHREPFRQTYLSSIRYTGTAASRRDGGALAGGTPGVYLVELHHQAALRDDQVISARSGFKTVLRRRLGSVDVRLLAGTPSGLVRRYVLSYRTGDMRKSLLEKVEVQGADESVFYAHQFGYEEKAPDRNDVGLFGPPIPWDAGAKDYGLGGAKEWSFGFRGFVGIGLLPYKGGGTVGVGFGYGRRQSETLVSTMDLNGDGLPDRVYRSQLPGTAPDLVLFNHGPEVADGAITGGTLGIAPPWGDPGSLVTQQRQYDLDGHRLGKDVGNSFDASVQAFYGVGAVNAGAAYSTSSSNDFVLDANGDGLPDLVNNGQVFFNQPRSADCGSLPIDKCCPAGQFCFQQSMPIKALQELGDSSELLAADPTIAQANQAMDDALTPEDAVLEWTAPYAGAVDLSARLAFVNPTESGERRDGVRLRIYSYHPFPLSTSSAELLETYVKTPGDPTETPVQLGAIPVEPGTVLYFVLSTLSDFPMNEAAGSVSPVELVSFAPVVTYLGTPAAARAVVGPSGAPVYRFDAQEDFLLAGDPQGAVNVPRTGKIDLVLDVRKLATSDDVRVCVQYQDPPPESGSPPPRPGPCSSSNGNVYYELYGAADQVEPAQQVTASVQAKAGGTLYVRIDSDLAIDPRAVTVAVSGSYACMDDDKGACTTPDANEQKSASFRTVAYMPLHDDSVNLDPSVRTWAPSGHAPTPYRVTKRGTIYIWSRATGANRATHPIFFSARTLDRLIFKAAGDHGTSVGWDFSAAHVDVGDLVFIEAHSESARSYDPVRIGWVWVPPTWGITCRFVPDAKDWRDVESCDGYAQATSDGHGDSWDDGNQPVLAGGFHGWRYGAWNGRDEEEFKPWVFRGPTKAESNVSDDVDTAVADMQDEDPTRHSHRTRLRLGGLLVPSATGTVLRSDGEGFEQTGAAFVSQDGNTYFTAGRMHAGKKGESASVREKDPEGVTVQPLKFAIGKIGRSSTSVNVSGGASIGWASASISRGFSQQKMDILDMNGDGIIDVVVGAGMPGPWSSASQVANDDAASHVRVTDPVGLHTRRTLRMSGFPQITYESSGQVGLGVSFAQRGLTPKGNTGSMASRSPSSGGGLAFSTGAVLQQLADVNGDGLPDQLRRSTNGCPSGIAVRLNMGTSFATGEDCLVLAADAADPLLSAAGRSTENALRRSTTVTLQGSAGIGAFFEIATKAGGGIDKTESWGASVSGETSLTATNVALVDVTGDGLPDHVYKGNSGDTFYVRVNTGYGFAPQRAWHATAPWHSGGDGHRRPRLRHDPVVKWLLDQFSGGDGIVPLEASGSHSAFPSVGFSVDFSFPLFIVAPWMHIGFGANVSPKKVSGFELGLQDIDGDGLADQVLKTGENAPIWARLNQLGRSNLLNRVTRPLGGSIDLAYEQRVGNTVDMPQSRWVLTKVVARDGRGQGTGHELTTEWAYERGRHDRIEREFLGFAKVTRTNPDGTSIEQEFDNESVITKGLLLAERMRSAGTDKKLLVETLNTWGKPIELGFALDVCKDATPIILTRDSYCGSFFTKLDAVEKRYYEGEPKAGVVTRQELAYNENGDVGGFWDYGDLADPQDDTTAAISYFADDEAAAVLHSRSRPKTVEVWDSSGRVLRARTAEYDANGNVTKLVAALGDGRFADTLLHWHSNGTLDWVEGPKNETGQRYKTTYGYDPVTLTYVAAVVDTHGYLSTTEYDARFGEPTKTVDVNGKITARKVDAFGRLTRLAGPRDTLDAPTVWVSYAHDAAVPYAWTRNRMPRRTGDTGTFVDTVIAMDGLDRIIQTKKTAEIATSDTTKGVGWTVTGHQVLDEMGRVVLQGQPFASFSSRPEYVPGTPRNPTRLSYDKLGRMIETVEPNGSISRVQYGFGTPAGSLLRRFKTTTTDAEGKSKAAYKDAGDRVVAVEERIDGRTPTTHYEYSPVGELVKMVDAAGNTTRLEYDLLGRRTKLANPDMGEIRFQLDPAGNLVRKFDANLDAAQASIHYVFDFDQLVRIEYPDASRNVTYTYGGAAASDNNGVGRVIEVQDDAGRELRVFGELGELTATTRILRAMPPYFREQSFTTSFTYDSFGRMMSITYPDGETVTYAYDAGGLLESATGHRAAGSAAPGDEVYLASMMYDAFGQRVRRVLGNGVGSAYAYDPLTRRLASLTTTTPLGRTLQAITYGYDRVGNVRTMVNGIGEPVGDQSGSVSFEYGYDDLYRLTSAYGQAKSRAHTIDRFTASYAYSDIHNMTSNVQIHEIVHGGDALSVSRPPKTNHSFAYTYDPSAPHRATKIGDTFVVYDGNGNTVRDCRDAAGDPTCGPLSDHVRSYAWTAENRIEHVIDGGGRNITRFLYDAAGDRVVKLGRGGEAITVGQFWSLKGRRAATKHVFAGATRLASKLLPPPGWDETSAPSVVVSAVTTTALSGTSATTATSGGSNDNGCDPSNYQPTKCPVLPGGEPSINHRYDGTRVRAETYYYHQDHLGSTSWVTDQNARVHEHVEYFPYGAVWRDPRSDADGGPKKGQRFLFTSKEMDEETGLYYFGARYLDPVRVRWASADPALIESPDFMLKRQPELNLYGYAAQNPLTYVDPDGRCAVSSDRRVNCAAPGQAMLAAGLDQAAQGLREGSVSDTALGLVTATFGTVSAAAGVAIDFTVGFGWNAGTKYGTGVDRMIETGGKDPGPLLEGSAEILVLAVPHKLLSPPAAAGGAAKAAKAAEQGWKFGGFKSAAKWESQMAKRGWTPEQIAEAIQKGEKFAAENLVNKGNAATRFVHPGTGRSVVVDDVTKEVLHVGGEGFKY
jgi:RHS repeat-associated protein